MARRVTEMRERVVNHSVHLPHDAGNGGQGNTSKSRSSPRQ